MDQRHPFPTTPRVTPDALTPRLCEVAALIAEGLTDAEIGHRLTITPATATLHVEGVLRWLECHTRVRVAVWAIGHGLVAVAPPPTSAGVTDGMPEAAF
jgi:DNA-binding NarL/FixJ family response regulator